MKHFLPTLRKIIPLAAVLLAHPLAAFEDNIDQKLEGALADLAEFRENVAESKIPLSAERRELEKEVRDLRNQKERWERMRDSREVQLAALQKEVGLRQDDIDYVKGLLAEYINGFSSRADPAEVPVYEPVWTPALAAPDNPELSPTEVLQSQLTALVSGMERLEENIGGRILEGNAVVLDGSFENGQFLLYGPVTYFASTETGISGLSLQGPSGEATLVQASNLPTDGINATLSNGEGPLPLDPTLGRAIAIASTDETLVEHLSKGGFWIYPILFAAFLSVIISLYKLIEISGLKTVPAGTVEKLLDFLKEGKKEEALHSLADMQGPSADMLREGVRHYEEPKELLEEILLEKIVQTQPKLERLLPMVAVTAATAPLLGLLGTVTGMINTFKLITIFGTGDAKSLSSGISEALITTEWGLIVAIPALIFHAFLSRKAKSLLSQMETTGMRFVNGLTVALKKKDTAA